MAAKHQIPLSERSTGRARRALILGEKGVADLIGAALAEEGFETEFEHQLKVRFPRPHGPKPLERLKGVLESFGEEAGAQSHKALYVHPGVSAWADRPELATVGQGLGISVVAPPSRVLTLFGNKLNLFGEAERQGIPNLLQSGEPIHSRREIQTFIQKTGQRLPLVLKAVRGGGGFGRYVVRESEDLGPKLDLWMEQLRRNTGEVMLVIERYVEGARYLVLPFARLADGTFKAFPMVDASLQSRFRKIMEFCPCEQTDAKIARQLEGWSKSLAEAVSFIGVGSLEFMVDGSRAFLVEALARLDTNFHLWERVAGTRAVHWQLAALEGTVGDQLPRVAQNPEWQAALSLRFYAEDSILQLPQPGMVLEVSEGETWDFPEAAAERLLFVAPGTDVRPSQSGLLGFLWVGARDRAQAMIVARGVLDELWIAGTLQTNERFLAELLAHPWVKAGHFHAGFVDEEFLPPVRAPDEIVPLLARIAEEAGGPAALDVDPSDVRWAVGNTWVRPNDHDEASEALQWVGAPSPVPGPAGPGISGRLRLKTGQIVRAGAFPVGPDRWQVRIGSWGLPVRRALRKASSAEGKPPQPKVLALVPGRVYSVLFRKGATIPAHEVFLIIESLGMLVPHALPKEVRVKKWKVVAEERVSAGQELADFEIVEPQKNR